MASNVLAKRAMALYHSGRAPSLEAAWAIVKKQGKRIPSGVKFSSKSKSSRKSGGRTAHLRKFQEQAAKAMKMHHSQGISLKSAWRKVKGR